VGQSVTFNASVTGQSPTGSVTFKDGVTTLCATVALGSGSASCAASTLSAGVHSIAAVYSGDTNNAASTSNTVTQQVNPAASSTSLGSATNPSAAGQSVTFTASVSGQSPTGTVTFKDGVTTICATVALGSGSASCATSTLSAGSHAITATYNGDTNNAASTSNTLTQQVDPAANPTTTLLTTACMTTFVEDQPFTMNASVTGTTPTGTLSFATQDNVMLCGNVSLVSGSASCTTSALTVVAPAAEQVYGLKATYSGDSNNAASTSAVLTVAVLDVSAVVFRNGFDMDSLSCPIE
jgi:hypothetical protein